MQLERITIVFLLALAPACAEPSATPSDSGASESTSSGGTAGVSTASTLDGPTDLPCMDPEASVAAIFMGSCLGEGCHGSDAAAGLDLLAAGWPERLIDQPSSQCDGWVRVVPGDPEASFLIDKLSSPVACGLPMPVAGALRPDEIACIETWISELAPSSCETCGGDVCIDTTSDSDHCGGCDSPCPTGVGCIAGTCACPDGTVACGDECIDTNANGEHCGGCDSPCDAGLLCNAGVCGAGCGALTECAGGCVDTTTNAQHCGGCDQPCPTGGACVASTCGCPGPEVSYAGDIEPLFTAGCTSMGCHGFPMPQLGLDLRAGMGYGDLVDMPSVQCAGQQLVIPGQPDDSYLMKKLLGVEMCLGTRMPKAAPAWPASDLDLVASWICQGAPE